MKRPSFQFYPADWKSNANLRRCSEGARGVWMDVLCLMHDSDEYGVLRWPLTDIARAAGVPIKLLKELAELGVLKGGDKGCDAYTHTPIHARKKGEPITLLEKTEGPCWYSSRFLVDEWRRSVSGGNTRFKSPDDSPSGGEVRGEVKEASAPSAPPRAGQSAGATSTSSSTSTNIESSSNLNDGGYGDGGSAPLQVEMAVKLRELGVNVTGSHPALLDWVARGVTLQVAIEAVGIARLRKPDGNISPNYLTPIINDILNPPAVKQAVQAWWKTDESIIAKGRELGISPGMGETMEAYKGRISAAIEKTKGGRAAC